MTADTTPQEELRKQIATIIEHARANAVYFSNGGFDAKANVEHETDKVVRLIERKVLEGKIEELEQVGAEGGEVPSAVYYPTTGDDPFAYVYVDKRIADLTAQLNQLEGK